MYFYQIQPLFGPRFFFFGRVNLGGFFDATGAKLGMIREVSRIFWSHDFADFLKIFSTDFSQIFRAFCRFKVRFFKEKKKDFF